MFFSFEGVDGSGKSTQARLLADHLRAEGYRVVEVREPGGTELSESIRSLLLHPDHDITPRAELLLFSAARAQLVDRVIKPALGEGAVVIADRFYDSTTAYQGAGRGLATPEWLAPFHRFVTDGTAPERTYLFTVSPETGRTRRAKRGAADRMEQSGEAFYHAVADGYQKLALDAAERVHVVDADRPVTVVFEDVRRDAMRLIGK